ncbi:13E12 repeat family protein [Nocardioides panacisoli]|uniref:DUF222 domain-containing protein n=1 Tax=Nocardioides panacisoli TaxID=627624 RepID=UPI001C6265A0|nr:DUF222 domain-containing protein [Nocardioides panacisoli]QYJ05399.1 13E12 repeat family protein [Nocardioides panacisoli]
MSWHASGSTRHPLLAAADRMLAALDDTDAADPLYLSTDDKAELLGCLARVEQRVEARIADTLAVSDDVAQSGAARSAGAWLAHRQRVPHARYVGVERLGERLREHPVPARAAATGDISLAHARAVVDAVEELPADIPGHDAEGRRDLVARAECDLVKLAADHRPREVRVLGRRILEVTAPEVADEIEGRLLRAEERRARERTELRFLRAGPGRTRIRAELPDHAADLLRKALAAISNPRRAADDDSVNGDDDRRSHTERQGEAFCQLLEHLPVDGLPTHGGTPVSLVVTIDERRLRAEVGAAQLDTGERLSTSAVRRLACQHGLQPAVLDGHGRVLDLGRSQRLFTAAQRTAHTATHTACQAAGCDIPTAWCEAHHKRRTWAEGGTTDLADLATLCSFHHHRAHDPQYDHHWDGEEAHFRRQG